MQPPKESRATTSCTECQRRKQKCSREWPCNHCQARKVPHLCQFGVKKVQLDSSPDSSRDVGSEPRGQKRSLPESNGISSISKDFPPEEVEDGLKAWGYMPGHMHYNLGQSNGDDCRRKNNHLESPKTNEVDKILHAIPPRSITDAFVNHFLSVVNHRYNSIYGPTFTEQYVAWWSDRASGKRLSPEFTCLLLRICAYSVQYLTPALRKMIEFELACDSQELTERFAAAAEQLSQSFEASKTCIERVQEQFLKGAWLKSESKIVESWHALGRTIHEAQELGIDKDAGIEDMSEFDIEIRRRLWTLLYIWDWQMSSWLGRPHLIDQKDLTFRFPSLRLDQSNSEPNLLSPFAHMSLAANLARRVTPLMDGIQSISEISADQVLAIEAEGEKFIEELPPIFRMKSPDLSLDEKHPYLVFQRCQLHVIIYITMFDFLKVYLTLDPNKPRTDRDSLFRKMGVEISLKLLVEARGLFDHEFPINAKFHLVVFCIFDTATTLCSAIIHDRDFVLPHREKVMDAIERSLDMLHQLSLTTKIGATSYNFLYKLVQATPALSQYSPIGKRQRLESSKPQVPISAPTQVDILPPPPIPTTSTFMEPLLPQAIVTSSDGLPANTTTEDLSFDLDQFLAANPFGNSSTLEIGGMENIWDWGNLNLETFPPQGPPRS